MSRVRVPDGVPGRKAKPKQTLSTEMKQSFISERRNSGMIRSFRRQPKATGGNGGNEADSDDDGPLVKRLRRGPLTPQTWVRFPHGSPKILLYHRKAFTNEYKCAILLRQAKGRKESKSLCFVSFLLGSKLVSMTVRVHPFPFRTRKLSSSVAKILVWRRTGKIARCRH